MDGVAEYDTTGQVWLDHSYLGDGWWYQPREAFEVEVNGSTELFGRLPREGVEWDDRNRFRPLEDVDEPETRAGQEASISQDWVYEHWQGFPIATGEDTEVVVRPTDHDVWIGRLMVIDRDGASLVYFSDAQTIVRWRGRADHDWGLAGIALWTIGQEDVRLWEQLEGGGLPAETKRLNA
ncbi:hypothetical protein [Nesterenkonia sp. PF2B19]|uniref:hypothetical protein n=1 Tax=Nesterenkonia sp. PF2B19 TaxID=1881858 RepID=UPI001F2B8B7A|nr:hypothetical protein [Nesterenkonia sp. PF2B19]